MKRRHEAMSMMVKIVFLAYVIVWPVGCTIIRENIDTPIDHERVGLLVGETDYSDALNQLGPPSKVSTLGNGLAFLYEHAMITEKQLGIRLNIKAVQWMRLLKFASARAEGKRQAFLLVFDNQGVLRNQRFHEWDENLGGGSAIQFFMTVSRQVDTSQFQDAIGPHQWGFSLLRPLPQTLNVHQSLDTGTGGLELQATPTKAGQHTLEMR